jgi:3-deoxy-7-phosphoheptulonate synthase
MICINQSQPLVTPAVLFDELPHGDAGRCWSTWPGAPSSRSCALMIAARCAARRPVLGTRPRGGARLRAVAARAFDARGYARGAARLFQPRTVVGLKGLINDPDPDGSFHINKGCASRGSCY